MADKPPGGVPGGAEFGQMVAYLVQHKPTYMTQGQWNQRVAAVIGDSPAGRTRAQITAELVAWFATFPRGVVVPKIDLPEPISLSDNISAPTIPTVTLLGRTIPLYDPDFFGGIGEKVYNVGVRLLKKFRGEQDGI